MKKTRIPTTSEFTIDAVEYLFVEWLRRRGVFSAFRANSGFDAKHNSSFRGVLRSRIHNVMHSSHAGIGDLISMSFIFAQTPEGLNFWFYLSFAWRRFCTDFQNNFN